MAAYRRVYDSHHVQADCQKPGSAPDETGTIRPVIEFGLPFLSVGSSEFLFRADFTQCVDKHLANKI